MFFAALSSIAAVTLVSGASFQNLQTSDGQLSISSPQINGIYVASKILPCTYIPAANPNIQLNLFLEGVDVAFNETVIAMNADISNDPSSAIYNNQDGTVYYQHSINYAIPPSAPAGNYQVTFQNVKTNVNTSIPITMLPFILPSAVADDGDGSSTLLAPPAATSTDTSSINTSFSQSNDAQ